MGKGWMRVSPVFLREFLKFPEGTKIISARSSYVQYDTEPVIELLIAHPDINSCEVTAKYKTVTSGYDDNDIIVFDSFKNLPGDGGWLFVGDGVDLAEQIEKAMSKEE